MNLITETQGVYLDATIGPCI